MLPRLKWPGHCTGIWSRSYSPPQCHTWDALRHARGELHNAREALRCYDSSRHMVLATPLLSRYTDSMAESVNPHAFRSLLEAIASYSLPCISELFSGMTQCIQPRLCSAEEGCSSCYAVTDCCLRIIVFVSVAFLNQSFFNNAFLLYIHECSAPDSKLCS